MKFFLSRYTKQADGGYHCEETIEEIDNDQVRRMQEMALARPGELVLGTKAVKNGEPVYEDEHYLGDL